MFVDAARGDYRVKEGSPALALGFKNFPMDQFGVKSERLRRLARTPELPVPGEVREEKSKRDSRVTTWLGAKVKNIIGLGEVSAAGLPGEIGVSLVEVPAGSAAAKAGLEVGDVILKCAGQSDGYGGGFGTPVAAGGGRHGAAGSLARPEGDGGGSGQRSEMSV